MRRVDKAIDINVILADAQKLFMHYTTLYIYKKMQYIGFKDLINSLAAKGVKFDPPPN